jgi:hypothetical protein
LPQRSFVNRPGRRESILKDSATPHRRRAPPLVRRWIYPRLFIHTIGSEGHDMNVARVLLSVSILFVATSAHVAGAESAADDAVASAPAEPTTPTPSPWGWLAMPKVTMPKISMPKMPADPLAPVKTSAKKVSDGTKKAWEGTKEIFTFGGSKPTEDAGATTPTPDDKPSIWKRMFGGEEKKEPEGPRTVAEFMAQKRLDP